MVARTTSNSVWLEHKGTEKAGVRPAGDVGRGLARGSAGCHLKESGGQQFSSLVVRQSFLGNLKKKCGCLLPSSPIKSESR